MRSLFALSSSLSFLTFFLLFSCTPPPLKACVDDPQCAKGEICLQGYCLPGCRKEGDCPPLQFCRDLQCQPQLCKAGEKRECYDGDNKLLGQGVCQKGTQWCETASLGWSACIGQILSSSEICDGLDNDCNGQVDDGLTCDCQPGAFRTCYTGPLGTLQVGLCNFGVQYCGDDRRWGTCHDQSLPRREICDGLDNDCNGAIDERLVCDCEPGAERDCYSGPDGTANVGLCKQGKQTCLVGRLWGRCRDQVLPRAEELVEGGLCNGQDENCDGKADNQAGSAQPSRRVCYTGAPKTAEQSPCKKGSQVCSQGLWGPCEGEVAPKPEICDGQDDDCDGQIDNPPPGGSLCPPKTHCAAGVCRPSPAEPLPPDTTEPPHEPLAEPKHESPLESLAEQPKENRPEEAPLPDAGERIPELPESLPEGFACQPGGSRNCYTGPSFTHNVGRCKEGSQICLPTGQWGSCVGEIKPEPEVCDGLDNDCNGVVDDPAAFTPPLCPKQDGVCKGSTLSCLGSLGWATSCQSSDYTAHNLLYQAQENRCDGKDNNCDGKVDEGCAWAGSLSSFSAEPNVFWRSSGSPNALLEVSSGDLWLALPSDGDVTWTPSKSSSSLSSYTLPGRGLLVVKKKNNGAVACSLKQDLAASPSGVIRAFRLQALPSGDLLVYGAFKGGEIKFGPHSLSTTQQHEELFVLRVDATCKPLWLSHATSPSWLYPTAMAYLPAPSGQEELFCVSAIAFDVPVLLGSSTRLDKTLSNGPQSAILACGRISDGVFVYASRLHAKFGTQYWNDLVVGLAYDKANQTLHLMGEACRAVLDPSDGTTLRIPEGTSFYIAAFQVQRSPAVTLTFQTAYIPKKASDLSYKCPGNRSGSYGFSPNFVGGSRLLAGSQGRLFLLGTLTQGTTFSPTLTLTPKNTADTLLFALDYTPTPPSYTTAWGRQIFVENSNQMPVALGRTLGHDLRLDSQENLFLLGEFAAHLQIEPSAAGFSRAMCKPFTGLLGNCVSGDARDIYVLRSDRNGSFSWGLSAGGVGDQLPHNLGIEETSGYLYLFLDAGTQFNQARFDYHTPPGRHVLWQYPKP